MATEVLLLGGPMHGSVFAVNGFASPFVAHQHVSGFLGDDEAPSVTEVLYVRRRINIPVEREGWERVPDSPADTFRPPEDRPVWSTRVVWCTDAFNHRIEEEMALLNYTVQRFGGSRGWDAYRLALIDPWGMVAIRAALDAMDDLLGGLCDP